MLRHVLDVRLPDLEPVEREAYAAILYAIGARIMPTGFQMNPRRADIYLRERPRVMALYLADIEKAAP